MALVITQAFFLVSRNLFVYNSVGIAHSFGIRIFVLDSFPYFIASIFHKCFFESKTPLFNRINVIDSFSRSVLNTLSYTFQMHKLLSVFLNKGTNQCLIARLLLFALHGVIDRAIFNFFANYFFTSVDLNEVDNNSHFVQAALFSIGVSHLGYLLILAGTAILVCVAVVIDTSVDEVFGIYLELFTSPLGLLRQLLAGKIKYVAIQIFHFHRFRLVVVVATCSLRIEPL